MAFFEDLKAKATHAANEAADKAKELAELTKLKAEIASQENKANAAFLEIGKKLYEAEKDNPESPVAELCAKVAESEAAIAELKARVEALHADN